MSHAPALDQSLLKSVSRSFYLSLRVLPPSMRPVMGIGYLLCRMADTIADSEVIPFSNRLHFLQRFKLLVNTFPPSIEKWIPFVDELRAHVPAPKTSEEQLIHRLDSALPLYGALSR